MQPSVGMFEKHRLHAPVGNRSDLGVVRRIEIDERKGLRLGGRVERIPLDRLNPLRTRNEGAYGIEFNAVPPYLRAGSESAKSITLTHTWIDHRSRFRISNHQPTPAR